MSRYQDTIIAGLLTGFAGFFAYEASKIPEELLRKSSGIVYYPLLLSALLAAASLTLLVTNLARLGGASTEGGKKESALRGKEKSGSELTWGRETESGKKDPAGDTGGEPPTRTFAAAFLPVLLGIAILAAYILALAVVGFIVSTPLMLVALLLAYGVRTWKVIASLSIGTTAVIYLVFYYLLAIQLP